MTNGETGTLSIGTFSIDNVREWLGSQVRATVVGPNADARSMELFGSDEPGWFEHDAPIRHVHADTSMFIGGLRALLLQSLHPLAMAGVAQHSNFRHDPWGRLQRTVDFLAATTFGPASQAQRAVDRVRAVHTRVRGTAPDGRSYDANDPHLMGWVHVTEIDSFLAAHTRFGAEPLSPAERDRYVADTAVIARALGAESPPESCAELSERMRSYRPELGSTREARQAARYLLWEPPLSPAARPVYAAIASAAVSLLPVWARIPLRLPWLPVSERFIVRPAGEVVTRTLRWATARA